MTPIISRIYQSAEEQKKIVEQRIKKLYEEELKNNNPAD